jgi:hypothetical protein
MTEFLWQLLREDPSTLSCDECFAVMEYYAELLAQGGEQLLPVIEKHLVGCPSCQTEHREALQRLVKLQEREHLPQLPADGNRRRTKGAEDE